jgi:deoxyribonuclease (pyrimidine dimer)
LTRINAGIPVSYLCDEHLLSEHREIKRMPNTKLNSTPSPTFRLGIGHVTFFKDKGVFTLHRYLDVHSECLKRGFNVADYSSNWDGTGSDYVPTEEAKLILKERIITRLSGMKKIHYYGRRVNFEEAVEILLLNK